MRGWMVMTVLALAGCGGEHQGMNPNYQFGATPYGQYLVAREAALTTGADAPRTIPIALPAKAPGPQQIAGRDPVPVPATMGTRRPLITAPRSEARAVSAGAPIPIAPDAMRGAAGMPAAGARADLAGYARAADHSPGTAIYSRPRGSAAAAARACSEFAGADAAQATFLVSGGPRRDLYGLDPDGDGYACGWTPAGFRADQL